MAWGRRVRITTSPKRGEVNVKAIPLLRPDGWTLYSVEDWPLIGAAPKGYLAYGDPRSANCHAYIAKSGRLDQGRLREVVTEEIISKIGALLPIRMARSRLVRLPTRGKAAPDVRFLSRNFIRRGEQRLVHGIEIVAQYFGTRTEEVTDAFELDKREAEQNFYTLQNMIEVLMWFGRTEDERDRLLLGFGKMLAFDAFVGAPDRHALNWGVVVSIKGGDRLHEFAPLFDTARGLFREHTDQALARHDAEHRRERKVMEYAERSRPVFGDGNPERLGRCNHFDLFECALRSLPGSVAPKVGRFVEGIHLPRVEYNIRKRFRSVISPLRLDFIAALLRFRLSRLKVLVEQTKR